MSLAPPGSGKNFNRVVHLALAEFIERRKKEAFARAMRDMASDPAVVSECATIDRSFRQTEADGLPGD